MRGRLSAPVLDAEPGPEILPFDGAVDAGDRAGAAFETTRELNGYLSFFGEGVEVCRAGIDTESFPAGVTNLLVEKDMGLFVVLKGVKGQLLGNFHRSP